MNKAFISYSLNTAEDYIVSSLSQLLQQHGFSVQSSYNPLSSILDFTAYTAMQKSDLFIGVITAQGQWARVWHEYQVAKSLNVPALLLAEDIFQGITPERNVIRFSRKNPADAIRQIKAIIPTPQNDSPNTLAWIAGGAVLLGLITLLSDDGKPTPKKRSTSKPKGKGSSPAAAS